MHSLVTPLGKDKEKNPFSLRRIVMAARRASRHSERTPLLEDGTEEQYNESAIAIASAFGDPNASAFATVPPAPEEEGAAAEAVEAEEPSRSTVLVIMGGMWIGQC